MNTTNILKDTGSNSQQQLILRENIRSQIYQREHFTQQQQQANALLPFDNTIAARFLDPERVGLTQAQCNEAILKLDQSENGQVSGFEKLKKLNVLAQTIKNKKGQERTQAILGMIKILQEIENDYKRAIEFTKDAKVLFSIIVSACNDLFKAKENLATEIAELRRDINKLTEELKSSQKRLEASEKKVLGLEKDIEKVKKDADNKIGALEGQILKLNEQLEQSDEEKAKIVMCQVMTMVPTLMVKIVFPEKKKYKTVYCFSELEKLVKIAVEDETQNNENSTTRALLASLTEELGYSTKDMGEFISIFRENCRGSVTASQHSQELNKAFIDYNIQVLLNENIIDEMDEDKCYKLASFWQKYQNKVKHETTDNRIIAPDERK